MVAFAICSIGECTGTGSSLDAQRGLQANINSATGVGSGEIFPGILIRLGTKLKDDQDITTITGSGSCIGSGRMVDVCAIFQSGWLTKAIALG